MDTRVTIEHEVREALKYIEKKENFVLSGGAGSGKTHSLISLIQEISLEYPMKTITCITYTNNAVSEIRSRIQNQRLLVSTIHEFVWSVISKFQNEIKSILSDLVNNEEQNIFYKPSDIEIVNESHFPKKIKYDEYFSVKSGKISHDHVLVLAQKMFEKFPKLSDILKDTSNIILIDEYQDTAPQVVEIFLIHIKISNKDCVIGFFGDSMQAIYNSGIDVLDGYDLKKINKTQNRRNPRLVINLANKLRASEDGIHQEPSDDPTAPNMREGNVVNGSIKFIYSNSIESLESLREGTLLEGLNFMDSENSKELWLTQKFNAEKSGFQDLYEIYNNDLLYKLIDGIRKKIKNNNLITTNKTLEKVASEANIQFGRPRRDLLQCVKDDSLYSSYYNDLKNKSWDNDIDKIKIDNDSLLAYKLDGISGEYVGTSKRDSILLHLDKIHELINLYKNRKYNAFLKKSNITINNFNDKKRIYDDLTYFDLSEDKLIGEVFDRAEDILNLELNENFHHFIRGRGKYLWERIKVIPFLSYINSINYQKEFLPYATQHSVKGSEYQNVLVVLDNGKWTQYDFKTLFGLGSTNVNVIKRTKKLFYVCCTRAKENLVVFMPTRDSEIIEEARNIFGRENVIDGESISP